MMNRRELLQLIAAASGWAMVGQNAFAYVPAPPATALAEMVFNKQDVVLLNEIAETIIPKTDTPGAKEANVGATMVVMVEDCYNQRDKTAFMEGLKNINKLSESEYKQDFIQLSAEQKNTLLNQLDQEAKEYNGSVAKKQAGGAPHYFTLMKQLTIFCFFTSKVGATKVLRYVAVPGKYDGNLPYQKGDSAWATR